MTAPDTKALRALLEKAKGLEALRRPTADDDIDADELSCAQAMYEAVIVLPALLDAADRLAEVEDSASLVNIALAAAESRTTAAEAALSAEYTRIELAEHLTKVANEKAEAVERSSLGRRTPVSDARSDLLGLALAGDCCEGSDTTRTDAWTVARKRLSEAERVAGLEKTK